MANWITPEDVHDRWILDETIPASDDKLEKLLTDAEDIAVTAFPDLPERIADGAIPEARVVRVLARMVIRHLRNPKGVRQAMETTGPYSQQIMHSGDMPGEMYLTDEDKADLSGGVSGKAFMIDTTPPPAYGDGPHRWLNYGGTWYE